MNTDTAPTPKPLPAPDPWPHPWPELWRDAEYLRTGTVFPPGTKLVIENQRGESDVIDATRVQHFRTRGWHVTGVDGLMKQTPNEGSWFSI